MDSSLIATFRSTCATSAARPAIMDAQGAITFAELGEQVERLASWLGLQGLRQGDVVGISIREERSHLLASLALLRLGCPQVTLASHDAPSQRSELIAKCRVVTVVGDGDAADDGVPVIVPDLDAAFSPRFPAHEPVPMPGDENIAMMLTGSGTTGRFKVIPVSHRAMTLQAINRAVTASSGVEYIPSPVEFLYPKKHRIRSAVTGYTSLLQRAEHSEVPQLCRRFGVDFLRLSLGQAQSLIDLDAADKRLPDDIAVYVGGSRIPGPTRAAFRDRQVPSLYVEYGATECGNISVAGPEMHERYPDGVGRPLPGVRLEIVDDGGRVLPPDVEGLIRIRTPGMVSGYLDDAELTAKMFPDGWYQGGDRGALTRDGILVFGGRADDMMILNSINIFPTEIEKVAEGFPGVIDCAAFPLHSSMHGEIPILAVVSAEGCDLRALLSYCRERLGIRAPRKLVRLNEIPRNPQGKVVRRELSARAAKGEFR
ncbi:class I adenylate-forming enzyme family protein [Emcibacter sp. SYSU 3D8]|uniref:class I adenylate-forming enzyme family protein n=1 Tax=Emcibacter sp. SYSU 3D8 TaxID=3133969 RepID=UPI0031FE7614